MKTPTLDPDIANVAPAGPVLTAYDEKHMITYMRVLDADQQGADWRDVSRIVLRIDPEPRPTARGWHSKATSRVPDG
jgi:hypothetical protein